MKSFLNKNWEAIGGVIIIIIAFYCGKYSAPTKIETKTVTVEVEKVVTKVEHQTITIHENKDGSKDTVIVTNTATGEKTQAKSNEQTKDITNPKLTNISLLAGASLPSTPVFGASVQRNIFGPITVGAWGLSNATVGLSVGVNF